MINRKTKKITLMFPFLIIGFIIGIFGIIISSCGGGEEVTTEEETDKPLDTQVPEWGEDDSVKGYGGYAFDDILAPLSLKVKPIPGGEYEIGTNNKAIPDRWPKHTVTLESFVMVDTPVSVNLFSKFIAACDPYNQKTLSFTLNLKVRDYESILARANVEWISYEKNNEYNELSVTSELWSDEGWQFIQDKGIKAPKGWPEPNERDKGYRDFMKNNSEFPVRGISYYEAVACCRSFGVRLPTEAEFEAAAGSGKNQYPWGDDLAENRASWTDRAPDTSGRYFQGETETDLKDMTGGVQQWTSTDYELYYNPNMVDDSFLKEYAEKNDKLNKGWKVTRGSSFVDVDYNKTVYYRLPLPKQTRDERVGFRFCHSDQDYVMGLWQQQEEGAATW